MNQEVLQILDPGLGATIQDRGRAGWRRFGVPPSGPMDAHAAQRANQLLDNPPEAPLIEFLLQGAKVTALQEVWIAVTGADVQTNVPTWRAVQLRQGEIIHFPQNRSGVWIYLAVEGGFDAPRILGSASVYARGNLGQALAKDQILRRSSAGQFSLKPGVAGRFVDPQEIRTYLSPPSLRVWRGPQFDYFTDADRRLLAEAAWVVAPQSDRAGYRLSGPPLRPSPAQIISEPVVAGSIQVPQNGQPIVIMRDGPTVGGYPKLGVVDLADLSWLAQCRPGQEVRFQWV